MKPIFRLLWIVGALLLTGVVISNPVEAQQRGQSLDQMGPEWTPMSRAKLERIRGGFIMPSGLVLSFGIERAVYVNGQLTATSSFHVADLSGIASLDTTALSHINDTLVVQVGQGNSVTPGAFGGVVIQNTIDNQDIRTLTTVNAAVGTLGMFQDLNTGAALQSALQTAPAGP